MLRVVLLCLSLCWSAQACAERVTVFAAASLKTALDAVADLYAHDVTLVYAGSSALARQIAAGAPADLFISANVAWVDDLQNKNLLVPESGVDLLGNTLVAVAPKGTETNTPFEANRIAMAFVEAVPAGIYGKAALIHLGLWEDVASRVVQTDNVRAALAFVALGEVPLGIVYGSDALAEPRVTVVHRFASEAHPPIVYPATRIRGGGGGDFLAFLQSDAAKLVFEEHGFEVLP